MSDSPPVIGQDPWGADLNTYLAGLESQIATGGVLPDDSVTNAKLANMVANRIKGAVSAGNPVDLTPSQARAIIASDSGSSTSYFNGAGAWSVPPTGSGGGITTDQAIDAVQAAMTATAPIVVTHDAPTQTIKLTGPTIETTTGSQAKVDAHAAVTTSIHGISNTASLETTSGAQAKVDTHVNDTSAAHAASAVSFAPAGTIAATTVQAAVAEVATEAAAALTTGLATKPDSTTVDTIVTLNQAAYDAIVTKDPLTLYFITA